MASQSLYRKWRSQTFNELVGQEPVIRTLKNALSGGKLAHAYIFTGPRGTGKTTTARLLAKTINCLNPRDGEPCNECQQCREITTGTSFNVIEIDAASNRGIDSIRDLREKVMMPPATGKYKVYVLDEAHMLTTEAFNALLKTLEEPPPYAVFVMATTDVHKMLPTVLSRCQRFDFKRITTRQIVEHLHYVSSQEEVRLEKGAAELIARAAAGGMRDALSLLDQAIAYAGNEISLAQVQAMLGVADPRAIHTLVMHVANMDSSAVLHLVHDLSEAGADLRQVNAQVVEYWRALMLARAGADVATILDRTEDEVREIEEAAGRFGLEELTECARVFAQNELVQRNQGTPQLGLELAFLECIEVHRRAQAGRPLSAPALPAAADQPRSTVARPPAPLARPSPAAKSETPAPLPPVEDSETSGPPPTGREQRVPKTPVEHSDGAAATGPPSLTLQRAASSWENVKKRVKQKDPRTAAYLNDYAVIGVEGTTELPVVVIQAAHDLHYRYVNDNERYKHVDWALATEFGFRCGVRLLPPGQQLSTAALRAPASTSTLAPQRSARRERSSPALPASSEPPVTPGQDEQRAEDQGTPDHNPSPTASQAVDPPPLARTSIVGENAAIPSPALPREAIEQKATKDPRVKEVMKTFTAKIVEIRPK